MSNPAAVPARREDSLQLQSKLEALVQQLREVNGQTPELFRRLCRLAREHQVAPEDFRRRLVRAGLPYSRASEFKILLDSETACAGFLQDDPARRIAWRESLRRARGEAQAAATKLTEIELLAAEVAGLMHRLGRTRLLLSRGVLTLTAKADELPPVAAPENAVPPPAAMSAGSIMVDERSHGPIATGLQSRIAHLVAELRQHRVVRKQQELYREFVTLGVQCGESADAYHARLVEAGLKKSRASELKRIVQHADAAARFIHATAPISYRVALRLARNQGPCGRRRQWRHWARRMRRLRAALRNRGSDSPWSFDCGLFVLNFTPHAATDCAAPPEPPADSGDAAARQQVTLQRVRATLARVRATRRGAGTAEKSLRFVTAVAPDTEARLTALARRSGLNRSEIVGELLQRASLPPLPPTYEAPVRFRDPEEPEVLPVVAAAPDAARQRREAEVVQRKRLFRLQRRNRPNRAHPDVCRVPVTLPVARVDLLLAFADRCALSLGELANHLLEAEATERLREIAAALQAAACDRDDTLRSEDGYYRNPRRFS